MSFRRINQFKVNIKNFRPIKKISSGAFSIVYEVEEKSTRKRYAAKVILTDGTEEGKTMINREVQIMIRVVHPTIIKFHGFSTIDFDGQSNITIFMDLMSNGSLEQILEKVQKSLIEFKYDNTTRQIILVGIAYGMMSLHQNSVIHRDLKPGNILIDGDCHPHISDFGLSKFIESGHSKNQSKTCGTPIYMAPEIIEGKPYNAKADVYSFGIIMYQIITDTRPYPLFDKKKLNEFQFNRKVIDENYRPKFTVPVKKGLKKLIEQCWSKDPKNRPTFEDIFNRLAYNREVSIYDVFDEKNEEEDKDEDETPYYLEDVDVDELFMYLDHITRNVNNSDNQLQELIEQMQKTISNQQKISLEQKEQINKQINQIQHQNERIDQQDKLINDLRNQTLELQEESLEQKEQINKQINQIQHQNKRIDQQDKLISDLRNQTQQQNEQINSLRMQIQQQMKKNNNAISTNILSNFNKYFIPFQQIFYKI